MRTPVSPRRETVSSTTATSGQETRCRPHSFLASSSHHQRPPLGLAGAELRIRDRRASRGRVPSPAARLCRRAGDAANVVSLVAAAAIRAPRIDRRRYFCKIAGATFARLNVDFHGSRHSLRQWNRRETGPMRATHECGAASSIAPAREEPPSAVSRPPQFDPVRAPSSIGDCVDGSRSIPRTGTRMSPAARAAACVTRRRNPP